MYIEDLYMFICTYAIVYVCMYIRTGICIQVSHVYMRMCVDDTHTHTHTHSSSSSSEGSGTSSFRRGLRRAHHKPGLCPPPHMACTLCVDLNTRYVSSSSYDMHVSSSSCDMHVSPFPYYICKHIYAHYRHNKCAANLSYKA